MPGLRGLFLTAAAVAAVLSLGGTSARADYSYDVSISPSQLIHVSDQTTIRIVPQAGGGFALTAPQVNNLPLATITFEKNSVGTENIDVNYSMNLNLTNPQTGGESKSFTIAGRLFGSAELTASGSKRLDLSNQYLSITPDSGSQTIGGSTFQFELPLDRSFKFAGPGFGPGLSGSFTSQISIVPEPVSVVMLGLGCAGAFLVHRRRSRKEAAKA